MIPTLYDNQRQAWVVDGRYVRCGHLIEIGNRGHLTCACYGRLHEGEEATVHVQGNCVESHERGPHVEGDCPLPPDNS